MTNEEMNKRLEEVIKALRCSATPGGSENCAGCPYLVIERVSDEDVAKCGFSPGAEFESCNTDRIALDAAGMLEAMQADLRRCAAGFDPCGYCAHCCAGGAPVYRPEEGYLAYCKNCGDDYGNFEWRGIQNDGRTGNQAGS